MYAYQKYLFAINFFVTYCWSAGFREPATMKWREWEPLQNEKVDPQQPRQPRGGGCSGSCLVWEVLGHLGSGSQSRIDKERRRDRRDESILSTEAASQHKQNYCGLGSENTLQMGGDGSSGALLWWKDCGIGRLCQWLHTQLCFTAQAGSRARGQKSVLPPCYEAAKCALTWSWGSLAVVNTGATEAFKEKLLFEVEAIPAAWRDAMQRSLQALA